MEECSTEGAEETRSAEEMRDLIRRVRRTNLNLLPVLHSILVARGIGQAARDLNLTQPAVSQALRQLRAIFSDELIVMSGREAALTERGAALIRPLEKLIGQADALFDPGRPFDPLNEPLRARIVTADYVALLIMPFLMRICADQAPHVTIDFVGIDIKRAQDLSQMDLLLAPKHMGERLGKRLGSMPLWTDRLVCMASTASPLLGRITREHASTLKQLRITLDNHLPDNSHAIIQPASAWEDRQGWSSENYLVVAQAVAMTDAVAFVPALLAQMTTATHAVRIIEIEDLETELQFSAFWSPQMHDKRGHRWLRKALERSVLEAVTHYGNVSTDP